MMKLIKREFINSTLIVISILGLFFALLLLLSPNAQTAQAATTSPPTTTTTSPPKTSTNTDSSAITPAAELTANGLGQADATVTDMEGNPIKPDDNLYTWLNFNVHYNWSIPDGVEIKAGDTIPFTLPDGLVTPGDMSFPIYDSNNQEIGTATIKAGESTGTITFNNVLENTNTNRHGTLSLVAKGTNTGDGNEGENWMFNKNGWIAGYDQNQVPNELTWNVAFNPNEHNLKNVVITDTLGPNQEYIPGSLTAIGGSYTSGGFVSNGQQLNPTVTTNGNQVIISFPGTVTTAVDIYYRVKVTGTNPDGTTTWTNHATMGSSEGDYTIDSSTSWGGSGTGNGDNKVGTMTLTKTDATTGAPLAGAEYELKDAKTGNVIISNAKTDENGRIAIKNLNYGSYTLTEVKAPDGYTLNPTPIEFTLPGSDGSVDLTTDQKDTGETGAVVLTKLDPDTKATIAGTTFDLLDKNGNVIQQGLVTDLNGQISVDNLPAGEYQFVETQPAAGYEANKTPIEFTVVAGQTTPVELEKFNVSTTVVSDSGNVVLTKVDAKLNTLLPGAVFDLLDSSGKVIQSGLTTNSEGQIVISNLEAGNYSFVETAAPEGYEIDKTPIGFTVVKDMTNTVEAKDEEEAKEPGVTEPPVTGPTEPGNPEPPVTGPTEPGEPEPPITGPTEPGEPEPPITGPTEPGNPEPPVTGPTEPGEPEPPITGPTEPGKPEPPVTGPTEPSKPEPPVTGPTEPEIPGVTVPPVYPEIPGDQNDEGIVTEPEVPGTTPAPDSNITSPSTGNNGSSTSGSDYGEAKFPQTGNESGLLMMLSGFFIALFVLLRHLIKKLNY